MTRRLNWGIAGPGQIARVFAESVTAEEAGTIEAVFGRNEGRTRAFADAFSARSMTSRDALLTDSAIDALYVATPHTAHAELVRAALTAGKAVLCEKPLTTDPTTTSDLFTLAERHRGVLLEGWMYRGHPQITRLVDLLRGGAIGRVRHLRSGFGFVAPSDRRHRLLDPELGGGAILDVGGYPLSLALLVAAAAENLERPGEPELAPRMGEIGGQRLVTGVDGEAFARLEFPSGLTAELTVSILRDVPRRAVIEGEKGNLVLEDAFLPLEGRRGRTGRLTLVRRGREEVEEIVADREVFAMEALEVGRLVDLPAGELRRPRVPLVDAEESTALARLALLWREGL